MWHDKYATQAAGEGRSRIYLKTGRIVHQKILCSYTLTIILFEIFLRMGVSAQCFSPSPLITPEIGDSGILFSTELNRMGIGNNVAYDVSVSLIYL